MSEAQAVNHRKVIYGVNDKPPLPKAIILALQHVLTMFGATVSVPLLYQAPLELTPEKLAILISSVMICSGLATLVQITVGSRLPIIQGVSFSFLAAFFACIEFAKANPVPGVPLGTLSMEYIAGAIIVGSIVEIIIGFTGLMGKLRKVLTPVVVGPVIMLIGLALFQHGAPKAGQYWPISALTIIMITLFSLVLSKNNQFFKLFPILLAIIISWFLCFLGSQMGMFQAGHPAFVDLSNVGKAPWFRLNLFWGENPILLPWGMPRFDIGLIFATLAGFLASAIESFGDYHACAAMAGEPDPTDKQINHGIGSEGIGCLITGLFGGFSSTSYSENIGLVGITKVASLFIVMIGSFMLIGMGILTKFAAVVATIPSPVVGGLYCSLFGLISAVGIQQLSKADLYSDRNLFIAGFSLFMGLSLPAYFSGSMAAVYPPGPEAMLAGIKAIPMMGENLVKIVTAIGGTGMAVGAICGLILDNIIPGTDEERGIAGIE